VSRDNEYGDHDMAEETRLEHGAEVRWVVCRRCGCEMALDERTQRLPNASCNYELARGVMKS